MQVERRAADDFEHIGGGGLLLQRFAQFVEQARVFDGDDRLCGEALYELNLLFGERAYLLAVNGEDTDQLFIGTLRKVRKPPSLAAATRMGSPST